MVVIVGINSNSCSNHMNTNRRRSNTRSMYPVPDLLWLKIDTSSSARNDRILNGTLQPQQSTNVSRRHVLSPWPALSFASRAENIMYITLTSIKHTGHDVFDVAAAWSWRRHPLQSRESNVPCWTLRTHLPLPLGGLSRNVGRIFSNGFCNTCVPITFLFFQMLCDSTLC